MANKLYIRDTITLSSSAASRFLLSGVGRGETLHLVARVIEQEGFAYEIPWGVTLVLVADSYIGSAGSAIYMGAAAGSAGAVGATGAAGVAVGGSSPGGPGGQGGNGAAGGGGGTIRVFCKEISGLNIQAPGGPGGAGGAGGTGGRGGDGRIVRRPIDPITIDGTHGGPGGNGGNGGPGGGGGHVTVVYVTGSAPAVAVGGGAGGAAGPGGQPGKNGLVCGDDPATHGAPGVAGPGAPAGSFTNRPVDENTYWGLVLPELGAGAADWAAHRLKVGEYFYRGYIPGAQDRENNLVSAVNEFEAVLRLTPGNVDATRLREQIWQNQNVIGLPVEMDVVPHFDEYIQAYTSFGSLILGVFQTGNTALIQHQTAEEFIGSLQIQVTATNNAIAAAQDDLQIAQEEQKEANDAVSDAKDKLDATNKQIQASLDEMNHHSFSFGQVVGVVGEVAGAVCSVIAAIPTGGASLVALVPAIVALTKTVVDNAKPLAQELFKGNDAADVKAVKDAYGKVQKNVSEVINDVKVIINFVNLIEKLAAGSTSDNSKYVALVQKGAEQAHEYLLTQRRADLALMRTNAVNARIGRANQLLTETQQLIANIDRNTSTIVQAGLRAIHTGQARLDNLLGFAFRAQRSVEIYTLKDESKNLYFDAGYAHPDLERDYAEYMPNVGTANLIAAYTDSWSRLLQPVAMQADYLAYFDNQSLNADIRRREFTDAELIQSFKDRHAFDFSVEAADIPAGHFDAKIQGVFIALVGATSPSGVVSCEVRHGDHYAQWRPDGTINTQLLQAKTVTRTAHTTELQLADVSINSDPPLTAPQSLAFWGRGIGGRWTISVPQSEFELHGVNLSGLTKIEVWLAYQFLS